VSNLINRRVRPEHARLRALKNYSGQRQPAKPLNAPLSLYFNSFPFSRLSLSRDYAWCLSRVPPNQTGGRDALREIAKSGKAATHPLHLPLFLDESYYAREGLGSKMLGARGPERQRDIGKFDVGAAGDFYRQR